MKTGNFNAYFHIKSFWIQYLCSHSKFNNFRSNEYFDDSDWWSSIMMHQLFFLVMKKYAF